MADGGFVAKDFGGGFVAGGDDAFLVDGDDGVGCGVEDGVCFGVLGGEVLELEMDALCHAVEAVAEHRDLVFAVALEVEVELAVGDFVGVEGELVDAQVEVVMAEPGDEEEDAEGDGYEQELEQLVTSEAMIEIGLEAGDEGIEGVDEGGGVAEELFGGRAGEAQLAFEERS